MWVTVLLIFPRCYIPPQLRNLCLVFSFNLHGWAVWDERPRLTDHSVKKALSRTCYLMKLEKNFSPHLVWNSSATLNLHLLHTAATHRGRMYKSFRQSLKTPSLFQDRLDIFPSHIIDSIDVWAWSDNNWCCLPPKWTIFLWIQHKARCWSQRARLPAQQGIRKMMYLVSN